MNLRDAILKGAERVDKRGTGQFLYSYVEWDDNDEDAPSATVQVEACALGAAYLGCHPGEQIDKPDYEPGMGVDNFQRIVDHWADDIAERCSAWVNQLEDADRWFSAETVFRVNDSFLRSDDGWDVLVTELAHHGVAEAEVCDDPGEGCNGA